jgi:hypothetical protein
MHCPNTVVIQFNNTTNFDGYDWNLAEIIYSRIIKIVGGIIKLITRYKNNILDSRIVAGDG